MGFMEIVQQIIGGFGTTLFIFFFTLLFSMPLGIIFALARMSKFKPLNYFMQVCISLLRGTPLMLQLFVIWYIPPLVSPVLSEFLSNIFSKDIEVIIKCSDRMSAAMIAFIINYAAYFSEIYRGGIEGIPKGQYEAGYVLGMKKSQIFFKVVLLQVIKRIIAPMSNEIITLVKDTSLARVIAVGEILKNAERFTKQGLIWPIFYTGAFFLIFCGALTLLFRYFEKKLDYYKG